jgi:hypothetical protein
LGAGISLLEPWMLAPSESLRPSGTSQYGPPTYRLDSEKSSCQEHFLRQSYGYINFMSSACGRTELLMVVHTRTVESRAARARMSAQETVPGQAASRAALIWSTTSNPLREFLLGFDPFSLTMLLLLSNSTDASQPCTSNSITED